ncbi:MAG: GNAT family N-acetyltransferase [Leptolyngbyaceae cyanobacterium]
MGRDTNAIEIRSIETTDLPELLRLMEAIVTFERGTNFKLTEAELLKRGFGEHPEFGAFVADAGNGKLVGMAVYYEIPFMHTLQPLFMLKWLYVDPKARGKKLGKHLLKAVSRYAYELGHKQLYWFVLHDNEPAQQFYESLGATKDPEWMRWTMPPEAMKKLAIEPLL